MKIRTVVNEIKAFLKKENCLVDEEINSEKEIVIQNVVFFLALNCEYNEELEMDGCEHLMGIQVKLSKCLFANIVVELNLANAFAFVLGKFPLKVQTELLQEVLICLRKADASIHVPFVTNILTTVIKQLNVKVENDQKVK